MKNLLFFLFAASAAVSCNNQIPYFEAKVQPVNEEKYEYPYTSDRPFNNWEIGDEKNIVLVLNSLKAYQDGKIATSIENFADVVTLEFDNYHFKGNKDRAMQLFTRKRNNLQSLDIQIENCQSLTSRDTKDEWVSIWYKQKWTSKSGKTDSLFCMEDLKIENGKIAVLDQKTRRYPKN